VVFGPHPRDFSYTLPQKIRSLALKSSLNAKIKENNIIVLDELKLEQPKTKEAQKLFISLKVADKKKGRNNALVLVDKIDKNSQLAVGNLGYLNVSLARETQAYEVMTHKKIIITKDGLGVLTDRLKK
jgi:large subunit ribosomal protein L4